MLELISKIPAFKCFRSIGFPRMLPVNLTVSLTYQCNSRCKTCRVYTRKSDELAVREYENIFKSLGRSPYWITFSGGEPFLRKDIVEICLKSYQYCKPKIMNIPTNGLLPDRIEEGVKKILGSCPDTHWIINLSIDAIGEKHDEIRGVKGAYEKAIQTYKRLRQIEKKNFTLGIHTVISKFNVNGIPEIYGQLKQFRPDSYVTEIAEERAELLTEGSGISPSWQEYTDAIDFIMRDMENWDMKGISRITRAFRFRYYRFVKALLNKHNYATPPCYAGYASCQIAPNGDVWACCIKTEDMGNLKDFEFDFNKLWLSEKAWKVRKTIKKRNCVCPLANASYTNMLFSFKILAGVTREVVF